MYIISSMGDCNFEDSGAILRMDTELLIAVIPCHLPKVFAVRGSHIQQYLEAHGT